MAASSAPLLQSTLLLFCLTLTTSAFNLYKSRAEVLTLLGEQEGRLYFSNCDQKSQKSSCVFALDDGYSQEPTQCAVTSQEKEPWWLAILETPSFVTKVTLLNIEQSYRTQADALRRMIVMANDDICFRYESEDSFVKRSFPCDSIADQIMIKSGLDSSVLALCDVEVYGAPIKFSGILGDHSVLQVASCLQSSVSGDGYCENAFDGDANNDHNVKPCAVTIAEPNPWMEATLQIPSLVTEIHLFNRGDCCADGLSSFTVMLNNRVCAEHNGDSTSIALFCKYFGDTVRITSKLSIGMSICEMQLLGYMAAIPQPYEFKPLGCYKDDFKNRDFTQLVSSITMSHDKCHKMCKRQGQKYFGVQNGKHCWCGSSYGKHGKLDDNKCSVPCEDNEKQMCGGAIYNNVFEIL